MQLTCCLVVVSKDHPVIVGVPPSPHAFGHRKFLDNNQNEDRNGPPWCKPASLSHKPGHANCSSKVSAHATNKKTESRPINQSCEEVKSSLGNDRPLVISNSSDKDLQTSKASKKIKAWPESSLQARAPELTILCITGWIPTVFWLRLKQCSCHCLLPSQPTEQKSCEKSG